MIFSARGAGSRRRPSGPGAPEEIGAAVLPRPGLPAEAPPDPLRQGYKLIAPLPQPGRQGPGGLLLGKHPGHPVCGSSPPFRLRSPPGRRRKARLPQYSMKKSPPKGEILFYSLFVENARPCRRKFRHAFYGRNPGGFQGEPHSSSGQSPLSSGHPGGYPSCRSLVPPLPRRHKLHSTCSAACAAERVHFAVPALTQKSADFWVF